MREDVILSVCAEYDIVVRIRLTQMLLNLFTTKRKMASHSHLVVVYLVQYVYAINHG